MTAPKAIMKQHVHQHTLAQGPSCMWREALLMSSRSALAFLPSMPLTLLSALLRVSLALTSTGWKPSSLHSLTSITTLNQERVLI